MTLQIVRVFQSPREKLFAAWTRKEMLEQWMCRDVPTQDARYVELDVRPSGRYTIEIAMPDCLYRGKGMFQEVRPPEKLVFTWAWSRIPAKPGESLQEEDSLVTVELRELDGGTEMTFTHELLSNEANFKEHQKGWEGCFRVLAEKLERRRLEVTGIV